VKKHGINPRACIRCHRSGFTQDKAHDGRPRFTCQACGEVWTSGRTGEPWAGHGQPATAPDAGQMEE
jgi:transposase-like protein